MKSDNAMSHRLHASHLKLGYDNKIIADDLSVAIPDGAFTVIVGPNACGKSTLLRALCRLLKPSAGEVMLDGKNISSFATKALARELGLLPQPRSHRTALPWQTRCRAAAIRTRAC